MWFKNIFIYCLPATSGITAAILEEALARKPLLPCSGLDKQSLGWVSCRGDDRLVHVADNQILFALGVEQNSCPPPSSTGSPKSAPPTPKRSKATKGRKQMKDIKQAVADELLLRASRAAHDLRLAGRGAWPPGDRRRLRRQG
jgi:recombination associated protein RdgC